jgi:CRISPR-associated protein Cmr1
VPRTPPSTPPPTLKLEPPEPWTVKLQTITPMFGGSAETRQVDPNHPIRAASVRGHLRFWWRATVGAQCSTLQELFDKESELWGNTKKHGKVRVEVEVTDIGTPVKPSSLGRAKGSPAQNGPLEGYFVHPFRENKTERKDEAPGLVGVSFTVRLTFLYAAEDALTEEQEQQVKTSVRAWVAFGGVGARTRRGCGALTVTSDRTEWLAREPGQLREWFALKHKQDQRAECSVLPGAKLFISERKGEVVDGVWRDLGRFWARFRKGHFTERRPDYSPMSGGAWRDHSTLKRLRRDETAQLVKPYLGLPIIYQAFPNAFAGALEAVHDQGKRLASPVILKPCAFQDGVRGLVLVMNAPPPKRISVKGQELDLEIPQHDPVLQALNARSPLAAVAEAAKRCGYKTEVRL